MKPGLQLLSVALAMVACAPIERSRELGNAAVPAATIAQQVCAACHGMRGVSTSPNFPHLAAQPARYLEIQLRAFRDHHRSDPAGFEYMWGLSQHLTDAQISGLAAYYAGQEAPPAPARAAQNVAGRTILEQGLPNQSVPACVTCHGADARGNAQFPRLAGQHADYLVKQLHVFQRSNARPDGQIMQVVAHGLSERDMEAITTYLESLPVPAARP